MDSRDHPHTEPSDMSPDEAAIDWFVRLRDEAVPPQQREAWEQWRRADPAHAQAWQELEHMWGALDPLRAQFTAAPSASTTSSTTASPHTPCATPPATDATAAPAEPGGLRVSTRTPRLPRAGRWPSPSRSIGAMTLVTCLAVTAWWMGDGSSDYATAAGERRVVQLQDGSRIELAARSALDVSFKDRERRVVLRSGEAYFQVAADASRPFVVEAANGSTRVLGTAFNINMDEGVTVAVTEHVVSVDLDSGEQRRVMAGQQVHYDATGLQAVAALDAGLALAWRKDRMIFRDTPLRQVLAEIQRQHGGYIRALDQATGDRRVTAAFDARRSDAALDAIAQSLNLRVIRLTDWLIGIDTPGATAPEPKKNANPT